MAKLTILSFGGGQDSTAILYKYIYDAEFRAKYAPEDFLVIMSDTGDEHYETRSHVEYIKGLCERECIEFVLITPSLGHHRGNWKTFRERMWLDNQIGSKALTKTCTDKLKMLPMANFIESYLEANYDIPEIRNKSGKSYKQAFYQFRARYGKITRLVGIASGEEKRVAGDKKDPKRWARECTQTVYPLIDLGLDRQGCQDYIRSVGHKVPPPSNCMLCPWMNEVELLWLYRFYQDDYNEWVKMEANKIKHFKGSGPNHGVWPTRKVDNEPRLLPVVLKEALEKYGHMTDADLQEYKMSHGHCVASKY